MYTQCLTISQTMSEIYQFTEDDIAKETWKEIKGHENYRISSIGRIQNCRSVSTGNLSRHGFLQHVLYKNSIPTNYYIHKLVALHFIPNEDNKPHVLHLGHRTDNRQWQLAWSTNKENAAHIRTNNKRKHTMLIDTEIQPTKKQQTLPIENEIWTNLSDSNNETINKYINYSVSDHGRIKNVQTGLILSIRSDQRVGLSVDGKERQFQVSRLVILAFNSPNLEGRSQVDHIDNDHTNHKLSNLRFATPKENSNNANTKAKRSTVIHRGMMKIKAVNIETKAETIFNGISRAELALVISHQTIKKYIQNGKVYKNYRFFKIEPTSHY